MNRPHQDPVSDFSNKETNDMNSPTLEVAIIVPDPKRVDRTPLEVKKAIDTALDTLANAGRHRITITPRKTAGNWIASAVRRNAPTLTIKLERPPRFRGSDPKTKKRQRKAIHRTYGNIGAQSQIVLLFKGRGSGITEFENTLLQNATKHGATILDLPIPVIRTEETEPKTTQPTRESQYRINIKKYSDLNAVYEDPNAYGPDGQRPIYCARENGKYKAPRSPLANPYRKGSKEQNISNYKKHLYRQMQIVAGKAKPRDRQEEKDAQKAIALLDKIDRETPLICYCPPHEECHTDVIRRAALYRKGKSLPPQAEPEEQKHATAYCSAKNLSNGLPCKRKATFHFPLHKGDYQDLPVIYEPQDFCTQHAKAWTRIAAETHGQTVQGEKIA